MAKSKARSDGSAKPAPKKEAAAPDKKAPVANPSGVPDVYKVKFVTSKGPFVIEVHREWAPLGADRSPLHGTPAQVLDGLHEYAAAGLQHLVAGVRVTGDATFAGACRALRFGPRGGRLRRRR